VAASGGRTVPGWLAGSGVIAVAMGLMNVSTYGFTIIAARLLGPREYGALAALMGLLLVVNVASLGLQATGARRVSAHPELAGTIESDILAATYRSAAAVGLVCLAASPVVTLVLRLDSWVAAALIAVTAVPLTVMGGQAGLLQGERRWMPLAGIYVAAGLGRVVLGLVLLVVVDSATGAMIGVALGAFVPVLVGAVALRHPERRARVDAAAEARPGSSRRVLRELFHNSLALLAFFALSNADVVMARVTLDEHTAGLYAGGLILAKAVLFLPQFVVVVAFPSMSSDGGSRRMTLRALGLVLAIGLVATAGAWALQDLAVQFIGGAEYAELASDLWAFAAVGTIWAMTQLLIYDVVAQQDRWLVGVVWIGLAALLVLALGVGSLHGLLVTVIAVEGLLLVVLVLLTLRRTRQVTGARAG
jgi:O-antigen/teichoic acid export membrane protein